MGSSQVNLLASHIEVGHCVILNPVERPCGRLVAVIVSIDGIEATCHYLNADRSLDPFNRRGMVVNLEFHEMTPVERFGVHVVYNLKTGNYFCRKYSEQSFAPYGDGSTRQWQESFECEFQSRPEVARLALSCLCDQTE